MIDIIIIKFLLYKEFYIKYRRFIVVNKEHNILYKILDSMYSSLNRDITFTEFKLSCLQEDESLLPLLETIEQQDVNIDAAQDIIKKYCDRQWAHNVALKAIAVTEGRESIESLQEEYNAYESLMPNSEENNYSITDDFAALYQEVDRKGGIQWRLPWLNQSIGGLHKGDSGFIFARTNAGKSTFVASEISYMLKQLDAPCCFFFNEEAAARMKWRIFQAYFGATDDRLLSNIEKCQEIFMSETKGLFHFYNMPMIQKKEVEAICKEMNPQLTVIDNVDKVYGFKGDREDLRLKQIYTWRRELAKTYGTSISICQAGSTAENKKWLQHTDIDSAHTAKSSEADFIIGIGTTLDVGAEDIRYLRLVKNKFKPGEWRHECRIDPYTARYREI